MNGAVYESSTGFIFGVRGEWLFKFSAVDGSLQASTRFMPGMGQWSSITAFGGKLYIGTTWSPKVEWSLLTGYPNVDIYKVDPTTLIATGLNLQAKLGSTSIFGSTVQLWEAPGWQTLTNNGTKLYGCGVDLFRVDPTNIPGYAHTTFGPTSDVSWDADHSVLWVSNPSSPNIWAFLSDFSNDTTDSGGISEFISGLTYCSAQQKVYFVQGDFHVGMMSVASVIADIAGSITIPFTMFNTGRINANSFRIKAVNNQAGNPLNGKVLIPTWNDDAVVVWDPASDTVNSVKTGFTAPFDIVVCPTTNFAVQTGAVGLKQII